MMYRRTRPLLLFLGILILLIGITALVYSYLPLSEVIVRETLSPELFLSP